MIRKELVNRSPLRILEQSTHGGLGAGNIGVIAAPKGFGKTACLVHIATDQLLEGKHVIHISFATDTSHIISWYEDIFEEIAKRYKLEGAMDVHDDIIRNRVIMNFRQDGVSADQVQRSVRSMIRDANFNANAVFVDGYDFSKSTVDEFASFKRFAQEAGLEIWFSASTRKDTVMVGKSDIPLFLNGYLRDIAVLINLEPIGNYMHLRLIKDHEIVPMSDLHLKLDPHILLIAEETERVSE
jgi:hypothetical protein